MAQAGLGAVNVPVEAILQAMADASVGELGARVHVPPGADAEQPLTVLAHALNILLGDLQQRERSLALQTQRIRTLLAHLPSGVAIAEAPHGRVLYRNPAAERILRAPGELPEAFDGYAARWPVFREDGSPLPPRELPLARAILRGEVVRDELLELRPPALGSLWLSCHAAPVVDEAGAVAGGIVVFEDVTEQRQARQRAAESDAFRRGLLDSLSDAGLGFIVSDGRRVLAANEALGRMLMRAPDELVGLDTTLLVVPEERGEGHARQEARVANPVPRESFRCHFQRADGSRLLVDVTAKPMKGQPLRFLAIVRDLTAEERARREAEEARRQVAQSEKLSALGSLVSGVAHEVRTPLTYLDNTLHLLERRLERALARESADPALRELLPELRSALGATERIGRLVEDLRRYTRLRAGEPRPLAFDEGVRRGVELFRATHRGSFELRAAIEPTPHVLLDELAAQQVVLNLLSNAAEVTPPQGVVHVRTRRLPEGALLEVQDQGPGIPPEVVSRVFEPFFTTKPHGMGLGLAIVKRIADEARGRVEVESAPGAGTTFRVRLPAERQGI